MEWSEVSGTIISALTGALTDMRHQAVGRYAPLQKVRFLPAQYRKHHDSVIDAVVGWMSDIAATLARCESWTDARRKLADIQTSACAVDRVPPPAQSLERTIAALSLELHNKLKEMGSPMACTMKGPSDTPSVLTCALHHADWIRLDNLKTPKVKAPPIRNRVAVVWRCLVIRRQLRRIQRLTQTTQLITRRFVDKKVAALSDELSRLLAQRGAMSMMSSPATPRGRGVREAHVHRSVINLNDQFRVRAAATRPRTPQPTTTTTPQPPSPKVVKVNFADPGGDMMSGRPQFVRSVLQHLPRYSDHSSSLRRAKGTL